MKVEKAKNNLDILRVHSITLNFILKLFHGKANYCSLYILFCVLRT